MQFTDQCDAITNLKKILLGGCYAYTPAREQGSSLEINNLILGENPKMFWVGIQKRDQAPIEAKNSSSLQLFMLKLS